MVNGVKTDDDELRRVPLYVVVMWCELMGVALIVGVNTMAMQPASSAQLASYFAAGAGLGTVAVGATYGALSARWQRAVTCASVGQGSSTRLVRRSIHWSTPLVRSFALELPGQTETEVSYMQWCLRSRHWLCTSTLCESGGVYTVHTLVGCGERPITFV